MKANRAAIAWGLRRLVRGHGPALQDVAARNWKIAPGDTVTCPPSLYLPDAPERITALSPWADWKTTRRLIEGGTIDHAPTWAHLVEGAEIAGAYVYKGHARAKFGFGEQHLMLRDASPRRHLRTASLTSNWAASHYFGMFLRGGLPTELLPDCADTTIATRTKHYEHEAGYRALFDLPAPACVTSARVDRLIFYTDFGHNRSKADRYDRLRARLRRTLARPVSPPAGAYLKRGATGEPRILVNEAEIEARLVARGFDIVEPARLTADEIARRCLDSPVIVSVEGSHLGHAIYAVAEAGTLLIFQPPNRFSMAFKEFASRGALRFAFAVGYPAQGGFRIDPDDLDRTLDLVT